MKPRKLGALPPGIRQRHTRGCAGDDACSCRPAFQGRVWSPRDGKSMAHNFATLAAAKAYLVDARAGVQQGSLRTPQRLTVRESGEQLVAGMRVGAIRTRGRSQGG